MVSPQELKTLRVAVKKQAKTDTKLFFSCPTLLAHSTFFQRFFPGLYEQAYFLSLLGPVPLQLQFFDIFYNSKAFL